MGKTHYAQAQREPESNYVDWSNTSCGLDHTESPVTDNLKYVTCKHCLRVNYSNLKRDKT